jgi:hypothetical protein
LTPSLAASVSSHGIVQISSLMPDHALIYGYFIKTFVGSPKEEGHFRDTYGFGYSRRINN